MADNQIQNQIQNDEQGNSVLDEHQNYLSDSDVDDPKYNLKNTGYKNLEDDPEQFQGEILNLQKNVDMKNKNILELENEINLYKIELVKYREKLASKDNLISQYEAVIQTSKDKILSLNQTMDKLKYENNSLQTKNMNLESEIKSLKAMRNEQQDTKKNPSLEMMQEHINDVKNECAQKESKYIKKYQEKEESLRKEFLNEISSLNKEIEELRAENGKLKFENTNQAVQIEKINSEHDEKNYEVTSTLNKKDKEISKLNDQIKEKEKKIEDLENDFEQKNLFNEECIRNLKEEKESLISELEVKDGKINEEEYEITKLNNDLNLLKEEIKRKDENLRTKDLNNDKLRNQIELLENSIREKENEYDAVNQDNQREFSEKNIAINQLVQDKNLLLQEKTDLENSLTMATNKIVELNEMIQNKFGYLENEKFRENEKNEIEKKKLLGMIKQLQFKEKTLTEENEKLKEVLDKKETERQQMEMTYQNELNNISLYNNFNNSQLLNNTGNNFINNSMANLGNSNVNNNMMNNMNNNNNYVNHSMANFGSNSLSQQIMPPTMTGYKFDDSREEGQKRTLDEFKKLLAKIDEKLDSNSKNY